MGVIRVEIVNHLQNKRVKQPRCCLLEIVKKGQTFFYKFLQKSIDLLLQKSIDILKLKKTFENIIIPKQYRKHLVIAWIYL